MQASASPQGMPMRDFVAAYLSPKLTHSDPLGFNTRTHSRLQRISDATNSAGVASSPTCPS